FDLFWRLNRSTKRTDVLFYFSDFQNRQKTGISYSPIPESVDPQIVVILFLSHKMIRLSGK
ncbi:hypothetical protein, partial [Pediococcus ethanolidurans]|uniref:hypothetical protein n=1 Tax=Pediococcus ethanolidurans TaxID=319653 RepID=UPI002955A7B0